MIDDMDVCEMQTETGWVRIGIDEALERRAEAMRCVECHGPVRAHRQYIDGSRAHFEHLRAHPGCSTKPSSFTGTRSRHPDAAPVESTTPGVRSIDIDDLLACLDEIASEFATGTLKEVILLRNGKPAVKVVPPPPFIDIIG